MHYVCGLYMVCVPACGVCIWYMCGMQMVCVSVVYVWGVCLYMVCVGVCIRCVCQGGGKD